MGATIYTAQAVEFFDAADGRRVFVCHEQTYEKNCYPHTPHWGVVAIGERSEVVGRLFRLAGVVEGGLLRPRSGSSSPEAYLRRWRKAARQARCRNGVGPMRVSHQDAVWGWNDDERRPRPVMGDPQCPMNADLAKRWDAGEVLALDPVKDWPTVKFLLQTGRLSAWRFWRGHPDLCSTPVDIEHDLFPRACAPAAPLDLPRFVRLGHGVHPLFSLEPGGLLKNHGQDYVVFEHFMAQEAEREAKCPGHFEAHIAALRKAIQQAQVLDPRTMVEPVVREEASSWERQWAEKLAGAITLSDMADDGEKRYAIAQINTLRVIDNPAVMPMAA